MCVTFVDSKICFWVKFDNSIQHFRSLSFGSRNLIMPTTQHKKEKSKVTQKLNIKIEPQELHPLGYYVDDRVELIRQIFMSLKSKTIKSIAPDFLQGKSLEAIQEFCLDELLGISKKRLQSIINATQCPANTDSSDSDVENVEEHISLEEISSDSADDKFKATKSKTGTKGEKSKNNGATATTTTGSGKKEISVLELLELQARARAIRSQLALEPITKIELDSDNDSDNTSSSKTVPNSTSVSTDKQQTQNKTKSIPNVNVTDTNGIQIIKPNIPKVKPVRLKRNFRQRQNDDYDPDDDDDETRPVESNEAKENEKKTADEKVEQSTDNVNSSENPRNETAERSPSPDIIPIIQEPETYCISSDSDEAGSSSVPKYITLPIVTKEKLPETEDEKFLKKIKEGSGADLRDLIRARRVGKHVENKGQDKCETDENPSANVLVENCADSSAKNENTSTPSETNVETENAIEKNASIDTEPQVSKDTEPEEGELTNDEDSDGIEEKDITILSSEDEKEDESKIQKKCENEKNNNETEEENESENSTSDSDTDADSSSEDEPTSKEADDDDDIIDLGKDEELDFEEEVEQIDAKNDKKLKKIKKKSKSDLTVSEEIPPSCNEDVIEDAADNENVIESNEIEESAGKTTGEEKKEAEGDQPEVDTWETRWLRGRNVTKVMATSRLASKVRTKIKQKKKKSEQQTPIESVDPVPDAAGTSTSTSAEEGSVKHYEELVAQ